MSAAWNTKHGRRRVRHDPPTLEEAIFAAKGLTEDVEGQAEIAASLMDLPLEQVRAAVLKAARKPAPMHVIAGTRGAQRSVVIERKVTRRFADGRRVGA